MISTLPFLLQERYGNQVACSKKFVIGKFMNFKMVDTKSVLKQVEEIQVIAHDLEVEVGSWLEIASPDDPAVIEVGQFAVDQHNKDTNSTLKFQSVVKGDTQIVGGMNWRLTIEVKDDKSIKNCEAYVYEQPWQKVRKLISFKTI
ncbi:unnamed protein product [Lactuca virosa]|uniref:Cystatin domain-containing protein n=1 Tax=Lactuca virosa TaxID=75947 RepID=A0AAU9M6T0_9ASTR|nr:unnamed protein product [Lactuca virosa]